MVPSPEGAATTAPIAVIINPVSGTGGRIDVARARAAKAAALLASRGADPSNVFITERAGHAREIALLGERALRQGKGVPASEAQPVYLRDNVAVAKK